MNSGLITGLIAGPNRLSKAVLSRKQSIPNAEIVQALKNLDINASPGIITTLPPTTSTLAALQTAQTFTLDNSFSSTTASNSTVTGAVIIAGGLGVVGAGYFGSLNCQSGEILALSAVVGLNGLTSAGPITLSSTLSLTLNTDATSSTAGGTLTVTGGASVSKKLFVGSLLDLVATTSTAGQITQAGTRLIHTFGTQNFFLGAGAGNFTTTGTGQNVGIGRISLSVLTSGTQNACIGDQSGASITTGSTNMLMGYNAGNLISTGGTNCAVGVNSLTQVTSTSNNVAIGYQSLGTTTGSSSTGIGHNAGYYSTGGNGTFIGQGAGIATATIGGLAGVAITSAVNCTMLGQGSGSTSATGDYRTAIGSDSRCNAANALKLGRDTLDRVIFPSWTANPASDLVVGMVVFRSDTSTLMIYTSTGWKTITAV